VAHRDRGALPVLSSAAVYGGLQYTASADELEEAAQKYVTQSRNLEIVPQEQITQSQIKGFSYLEGTAAESEAIQKQLTERQIPSALYSGRDGNEESFKALDGRKIAVIHLATHGFFLEDIEKNYEALERVQRLGGGGQKTENPLLRSGLILAGANLAWQGEALEGVEDGILSADEIARLNLTGTRLVVMSACQTGLGDVNNSEGVFGLQRAFKLAGVETLIMSLWEVDDEATAELMTVFYEQWLSGKSKQESFKEAQRQIRAKYTQPFYWAAFVLMD
jgi:CHAT domain-containing protein